MRSFTGFLCYSLLLAAFLSACSATQVSPVAYQAIDIPQDKETRPIALSKVVVKLPRGTTIGSIKSGLMCIPQSKLAWRNTNGVNISDDEFSSIFYEELKNLNYTVVGNPNELFEKNAASAEYVVGGLIKNLWLDICYPYDGFGNVSSGSSSATIEVEWQIYDALDRKTVLTIPTKGAANDDFSGGDYAGSLYLAFSNALGGLTSDKRFFELVEKKQSAAKAGAKAVSSFPAVDYPYSLSSAPISLDQVRQRVVTVQAGMTHGSGYVISDRGVVITNQHVVDKSTSVRITTNSGAKLEGSVVAVNARRDAAAILVPGLSLPALEVRKGKLNVGEEIYAIGSPIDPRFFGTVTRGIVSSYRTLKHQMWIQGDAAINPGNSGGPIVDASGALVGMSTLSLNDTQGMFFYAPIEEVLESLGWPL